MIHRAVKLLRIYSGEPQYSIAQKLGIAQSEVCLFEGGRREFSVKMVEKFAKAYSMTSADLLMFSDKLKTKKGLEKAMFDAVIKTIKEF